MQNLQDLIQQATILFGTKISAGFIIKSLKFVGFTEDDIKKLDQYNIRLSWLVGLEEYMRHSILPDLIKNTLQLSIIEIKDFQFQNDMQDFLNCPTLIKSQKLYNKILGSIPNDIIKDFSEITTKLRKHNKECSVPKEQSNH